MPNQEILSKIPYAEFLNVTIQELEEGYVFAIIDLEKMNGGKLTSNKGLLFSLGNVIGSVVVYSATEQIGTITSSNISYMSGDETIENIVVGEGDLVQNNNGMYIIESTIYDRDGNKLAEMMAEFKI